MRGKYNVRTFGMINIAENVGMSINTRFYSPHPTLSSKRGLKSTALWRAARQEW